MFFMFFVFVVLPILDVGAMRDSGGSIGLSSLSLSQSHFEKHSGKIWNGEDVTIVDKASEGSSFKLGPVPAFVALVIIDKADQSMPKSCSAMLFRRKFILTAGHCINFPPDQYELHAYLNPFNNPLTMEEVLFARRAQGISSELTEDMQQQTIEAFKAGITHGQGLPLEIAPPALGATNFGVLHERYTTTDRGFSAASHDVAVVPLLKAPFPNNSKIWSFFDVDLVAPGPKPQIATAYGIGLVNYDDRKCWGLMGVLAHVCHLQQKRMLLLSQEDCLTKHFIAIWWILSDPQIGPEYFVKRLMRQKQITNEMAKARTKEAVSVMSDIFEGYTQEAVKLELRTPEVRARLTEILRDIDAALLGVERGSQVCAMSESGTGNIGNGDSGGPLVTLDGRLVGIASWGYGDGLILDENQVPWVDEDFKWTGTTLPSAYVSVDHFRSWIYEATGA